MTIEGLQSPKDVLKSPNSRAPADVSAIRWWEESGRLEQSSNELRAKLDQLHNISSRLDEVCQSATSLLNASTAEDKRCTLEFSAQIKKLERYKADLASIEGLRNRLCTEREKVLDYQDRLAKIQTKIDQQKVMDEISSRRATWRLRMLLGFLSMVVIVWLLATATEVPMELEIGDGPVRLQPPSLQEDSEEVMDYFDK